MINEDVKPNVYGSLKGDQPGIYEHAAKALQRINKYRRFHVALLLVTFFLNGMTLLAFSYWVLETEPHCTLHSMWAIQRLGDDKYQLYEDGSNFGDRRHCQVVQYSFAASAIVAFVLMWFFLLFQPSLKRLVQRRSSHAARIVCPGLLLSSVLFLLITGVSINLAAGHAEWCRNFQSEDESESGCSIAAKMVVRDGRSPHLNHMRTALVMSFMSVASWGANVYLLVVRVVRQLDFPNEIYGDYQDPLSRVLNQVPPIVKKQKGGST